MNIKKNDKVEILAGKDKGKSGKVLQVMARQGRVSIEGLNLLIKHLRPNRNNEKGQRIEFPGFINTSNVSLVCPKCSQKTKVAYKIVKAENGSTKKFRACKKCQETID